MPKTTSILLGFLLLAGMALATNVSNCSILSAADTYVLNQSVAGLPANGDCILIAASNAIFDCNGFNITNNVSPQDGNGIFINDSLTNVTVKNCPSISQFRYGIFVFQSNQTVLSNNTVFRNNIAGIFLVSSFNSTLTANVARNNGLYSDVYGIYLSGSSNTTLIRNSAYSNSYGFAIYASSNNLFINNSAFNNTHYGFAIGSAHNLLINNTANGNGVSGIFLDGENGGTDITLINNTVSNNSQFGLYAHYSNNTIASNEHYYNNSADVGVAASSDAITINLSNEIFDNPAGDFQNFTNISINDSVEPNIAYSVAWAPQPLALPRGYFSFAGKFVNITPSSAPPSIDSLVWTWRADELPGYNQSRFTMWERDSSVEVPKNSTPDTSNMTLSLFQLDSFSTFGILQLTDTPEVSLISPANNSQVQTSTVNFRFDVVDYTGVTLACSLYIDGVLNRTNGSVLNDTPSAFTVPALPLGQYNWSVSCTNTINKTNSSQQRMMTRIPPLAPSGPSPPPPECSVDTDCPASQMCSAGSCIQVSCACGAVQDHQCVPYACCLDSQCPAGESCQNHACVAVSCSCGTVQDHQCVQYSCCQASDCGAGQSCQDHACITTPPVTPPITPPVTPGGTHPPPVTPGSECNTSDQCMSDQFCNDGMCGNVTGKCGYAADHAWVTYACGPEPGCPLCAEGNLCINYQCTPPAQITLSGRGVVGENVTMTVLYSAGPCASCTLQYVSPSGTHGSGTTDATGRFTLQLREKGTYEVTLVQESRAVSIVALAQPSTPENSLPTVVYDAIVGSQLWLMVLLVAVVGLVVYLRYRGGRGSSGAKEEQNPGRRS